MQANNIGTTSISELPIPNQQPSGMQQPAMPQPGMQQPGMQQPGMQQPGMPQPGMQQPGMPQPGMQQTGMPQPGMQSNMDTGMQQNVNMSIADKNITNQTAYNELVGQIQQADKLGVTQLPSRDIPNNTDNIVIDNQANPNYIPEQQAMEDYIQNYETPENIINQQEQDSINRDRIEQLYSNIQMPLLVSLLYFLFNLPVIRKYMNKYIPSLFNNDGNPNMGGYLVNSIIFGVLFYILNNSINNIMYA